jgi:putative RecB family exonuclease
VSLPLPSGLSPSKVACFKECALAFRFSAIDKLPEPPTPWTLKGTLVHRALERLFWHHRAGERTLEAALAELEASWGELGGQPELAGMGLEDAQAAELVADAGTLLERYFELEDPNAVEAVGVELMLSARLDGLGLRGIIDRLDRDREGNLVVTDYKTGRVPGQASEQSHLAGVQFYAFLCQEVLGTRPVKVQLLYLRQPISIVAWPTDQSMNGLYKRARAMWAAIKRACEQEDFRPRPSALCDWCAYKEYCPAWGGDPALAPRAGQASAQARLALAN